jgi:hypothetical protein
MNDPASAPIAPPICAPVIERPKAEKPAPKIDGPMAEPTVPRTRDAMSYSKTKRRHCCRRKMIRDCDC